MLVTPLICIVNLNRLLVTVLIYKPNATNL